MSFLDAFSHLYKRVCPTVCLSVHPSVRRPSVGQLVTRFFLNSRKCLFLTAEMDGIELVGMRGGKGGVVVTISAAMTNESSLESE